MQFKVTSDKHFNNAAQKNPIPRGSLAITGMIMASTQLPKQEPKGCFEDAKTPTREAQMIQIID